VVTQVSQYEDGGMGAGAGAGQVPPMSATQGHAHLDLEMDLSTFKWNDDENLFDFLMDPAP
jgi:hypothetical protein